LEGSVWGQIGGKIGGRIAGTEAAKSGRMQKLGKQQGKINAESGRLRGLIPKEILQQNGKMQGINNIKSGHIAQLGKIFGGRYLTSDGALRGRCTRWNINRGKPCICNQHTEII
jgi:hypothetical protein